VGGDNPAPARAHSSEDLGEGVHLGFFLARLSMRLRSWSMRAP
jgi:hypothetical protein